MSGPTPQPVWREARPYEPLSIGQLTRSEFERLEMRARAIYLGLPPLIAWDDAGEVSRSEFRRRALNLMVFDGTLLNDPVPGTPDYGLAELQSLDAEAIAVIRGEMKAGEQWAALPTREPSLTDGAAEAREVGTDGN